MKIYIATSWRNVHACCLLRDTLLDCGYDVLDWTQKAPPLPDDMGLEERRSILDSDIRGDIFDFCAGACGGGADLVIYLGPAGQDAACEVALAYASGTPVIGLAGPLEKPGLILSRCVGRWVKYEELYEVINEVRQEMMTSVRTSEDRKKAEKEGNGYA